MTETPKPKPPKLGVSWMAGAGLELAGAVGGLCLAGYWLDRKFDTSPWFLLGGAFIGIVGGLYNIVRKSLLESLRLGDRDLKTKDRSRSDGFDP